MSNAPKENKDVYEQYNNADKHQCELSEDFKVEKKANTNKNKNSYAPKVEVLPFGIKATELNKYMVFGEILGTPVCKKNRKAY